MAKFNLVAYQLELPLGSSIHPVMHVSLLKAYTGLIPPTIVVHDEPEQLSLPQPQAIVVERTMRTLDGEQYQVLVEWMGKPRNDATCDCWDTLLELYSKQALEDKVLFQGKGDVATHARTYAVGTSNSWLCGAPCWAVDFVAEFKQKLLLLSIHY